MQRIHWQSRRSTLVVSASLLLAMLLTLMSGCGGGQRTSVGSNDLTPDQQALIRANDENGAKMEAMIAQIESQLKVQDDGTLALSSTTRAPLSPEAQAFADAAIAKTNEGVKAGDITIDPDLTVHVKGAEATSRANNNSFRVYWWGFQWGLSNSRVNWVTNSLAPFNLTYISACLMSVGVPPGYAQLAAVVIKGYSLLISWVNQRGGYRGIWIRRYWVPGSYWIYAQT